MHNRLYMANLKQIAQSVGVSVCTVSKILAGGVGAERYSAERRAQVEAEAKRMGYRRNHSARALRSRQSLAIGILTIMEEGRHDASLGPLLSALDVALRAAGRHSLLLSGQLAFEDAARYIAEKRMDGLLIYGPALSKMKRKSLVQTNVPAVLINSPWGDDLPAVTVDGASGVRKAVQHVLNKNRKTIRYLGYRDPELPSTVERAQAVKEALAEHKIQFDEWTATQAHDDQGIIESAYAAVRSAALFDKQADAIICYDDLYALGAAFACRDSGLEIGKDVDVIGFGDNHASFHRPALSSVSSMHEQVAQQAVVDIAHYIQDAKRFEKARGKVKRIEPDLIIRT